MDIYYNNEKIETREGASVFHVIEKQEDVEHKAVWLNGEHLALDAFKTTLLKPHDRLKVVRIRGGG